MAALAAVAALATTLAGCSEFYFERRDGISVVSGDAVATDKVTHVIDPWPPASAQRHIAYDGERMAGAAQRYRQNRVTPPVSPTTSSAFQQAQQQQQQQQQAGSAGPDSQKP
jgi:hypothetical protein